MADRLSNAPTEAGEPAAGRGAAGLAPGVVVADTYEVTRLIGRGGMGAVWEAKHLRLPGKLVVLKVLVGGTTDPRVLARFRREAEIGSHLGHPNIVQVLDFNTLPDGSPCLVLELLRGETLTARLGRGKLPAADVVSIVRQLGSALGAAHGEGIVHRDLKPDNIFLCPTDLDGETRDLVKVLDFGISKMRGSTTLTQDSALMGTPQYMSPEQAMGQNDQVDARTDIFALGAITYEMLAGQPAFAGDSLASVVHAVVYAPSPPVRKLAPEVPAAVAAAVERALAKNRDDRFPDVGAFVKALTANAGPEQAAGSTQILGGGERPDPPRRKARYMTAGLASLVVAAGLAIGGRVLHRSEMRPNTGAPTVTAPAAGVNEGPARDPTPQRDTEPARPDRPVAPAGIKARRHEAVAAHVLSPAAAADLDEAEAALGAGKPSEAIRLAQHSL